MIKPIEALADCIMRFEGWYPPIKPFVNGSAAWRNRNPGNLRPYNSLQLKDEHNYRIFNSLADGWEALIEDLEAKILNGSHGIDEEKSSLHDLFNIYAPALDQNDPQQYSRQIAMWLTCIYRTPITADTKLEDIMKLGQ